MKFCHIVSHIDAEASGPSYSVPQLASAIGRAGGPVTLATLDRGQKKREVPDVEHLTFKQSRHIAKLGLSGDMRRWLSEAPKNGYGLFYSHGLWMMPNLYPAWAARRTGALHVVAPRGTLDPAALAYSSRVKSLFWRLGQARALRDATAFHATSEQEIDDIRSQGFKQPIFLSPNGVEIPDLAKAAPRQGRTLLYLGRLHEKKGLDMLLAAWERLEPAFPDWSLRIVGTGRPDFEAALRADIQTRKLQRAAVEPPLYGAQKQQAMAEADLFVLPTRGENFGMVIAEALASATPVVTTHGAPWAGVKDARCGWWVAATSDGIEAGLRDGMSQPAAALAEAGQRGRAWMARSFSWDHLGRGMHECYRWLVSGGSRPAQVHEG